MMMESIGLESHGCPTKNIEVVQTTRANAAIAYSQFNVHDAR